MTLVAALVAVFIWLGMTARELDRGTKRRLLSLITVLVVLQFVRGVL